MGSVGSSMRSLSSTRLRARTHWVQCAMLRSRPWRGRWPDACVVRHVLDRRPSGRCRRIGVHVADVAPVEVVVRPGIIAIALMILKGRQVRIRLRCTRHINFGCEARPVSPACPRTAQLPAFAELGNTVWACAVLGTISLGRRRAVGLTRAAPADRMDPPCRPIQNPVPWR